MCACAHTTECACLVCVWMHCAIDMCVLDMCNTFTKHNRSEQVIQVGAAAPQVFLTQNTC